MILIVIRRTRLGQPGASEETASPSSDSRWFELECTCNATEENNHANDRQTESWGVWPEGKDHEEAVSRSRLDAVWIERICRNRRSWHDT
jgi:hypothetical protein